MATLIDSSLWIDFTRMRSPRFLKDFIAPHVLAPGVVVAEPVMFEVLRYVSMREAQQIQVQFRALPVLATPADLWSRAAELGQACRKAGINPGSLDLIIAQVAIHHGVELVMFDTDFQAIANASPLQVVLLQRPTP